MKWTRRNEASNLHHITYISTQPSPFSSPTLLILSLSHIFFIPLLHQHEHQRWRHACQKGRDRHKGSISLRQRSCLIVRRQSLSWGALCNCKQTQKGSTHHFLSSSFNHTPTQKITNNFIHFECDFHKLILLYSFHLHFSKHAITTFSQTCLHQFCWP